jgi:predicted unusual protein kinase regulating ubiquinone biosynthesis (AarF/ABC1/UbiB family)
MLTLANLTTTTGRQAEIIEVVVRNGWSFFRGLLSGNNATPEKLSLPLPEVLCQILIDLGPTFVKLGQLLSTRPDLLSPDYIRALETLQSDVPGLPWSQIAPIIEQELQRPISEVFRDINETSIAAGSLAQVHYGHLLDGQAVAIKVQRPGIRRIIEQDLAVLQSLAELFNRDGLAAAYDLPSLLEEFRTTLIGELDFRREARNTEQMGETIAKSPLWKPGQVIVPKVHWQETSERLLTLEWLDGVKLTEAEIPTHRKQAMAALAVQVLMQQMFIDGIFHADPHPGNFFYVGDGETDRIALLDFGMVAILDPRTQQILTDLVIGIVYEQPRQVAQAVRELGFTRLETDVRAIESSFDRLLRRFYTRPLSDINMAELFYEALRIPRENHIQMPGSIGLCAKAIANIEGLARRLDPVFAFVTVARPVMERSLRQRLLGPNLLNDTARSSLYLSRMMTDLPQRMEVLMDRLERSELGMNVRWKGSKDFQHTLQKSQRRQTLAILSVGMMLAGSLLLANHAPEAATLSPEFSLLWSQALLAIGLGLGLWVMGEFVLRP